MGAKKETFSSLSLPPTHPSHPNYVKSLPFEEGVPGTVEK